jgi:hypothetical protein
MKEDLSLESATLQQLQNANSFRIYGHPLQKDAKLTSKGWLPILGCLCVQDSPENPCPCDHGLILWVKVSSIVEKGTSERKDSKGNLLNFYDIDINEEISVQRIQNVKVSDLKKLGASLNKDGIFNPAILTGTKPATIAFGLPALIGAIIGTIIVKGVADGTFDAIDTDAMLERLKEQAAKDAANHPK